MEEYKPQHSVLMLQPKCNMVCTFCVTEDSMGTIDYDLAHRLLTSLKERGFKSAIFGGGEPFFWPHDLKGILKQAKDLGLVTQVGTNATKLPADFHSWDFVSRWVIPVDGVSPTTHNQMRLFQNRHLEIIKNALEKLKEAGRSTTISTVVTKVNYHEILKVAEFLRSLQNDQKSFIHAWHLYKFLPFGRGGRAHQEELEIPDSQYEDIVTQVKNLNLPFTIFKRKDMMLSKTVEFYWFEDGKLWSQSQATGKKEVNVSSF